MCAAWPVALLVRSMRVLALVSQASVAICFGFVLVVLSIAILPQQRQGAPASLVAAWTAGASGCLLSQPTVPQQT